MFGRYRMSWIAEHWGLMVEDQKGPGGRLGTGFWYEVAPEGDGEVKDVDYRIKKGQWSGARPSSLFPSATSLAWVILLALIVGVTVLVAGVIAGGWAGLMAAVVSGGLMATVSVSNAMTMSMAAQLVGAFIAYFALGHESRFSAVQLLISIFWVCLNIVSMSNPIIGTTRKTNEQISRFNRSFELKYPKYHVLSTTGISCQSYVEKLFEFLMEEGKKYEDLPPPQSPGQTWATLRARLHKTIRWPANNESAILPTSTKEHAD